MTCESSPLLMSGAVATNRCQCPTCCEVFSTEANFDRHLMPSKVRLANGYAGPWCRPPVEVGLVQDELGVWKQPGYEGPIPLSIARLRATEEGGDA